MSIWNFVYKDEASWVFFRFSWGKVLHTKKEFFHTQKEFLVLWVKILHSKHSCGTCGAGILSIGSSILNLIWSQRFNFWLRFWVFGVDHLLGFFYRMVYFVGYAWFGPLFRCWENWVQENKKLIPLLWLRCSLKKGHLMRQIETFRLSWVKRFRFLGPECSLT